MKINVRELADRLAGQLRGSETTELTDVSTLEHAGPSHLAYVDSSKQSRKLKGSAAGAVIIAADVAARVGEVPLPLIIVDDAQRAFIQAMLIFRPLPTRRAPGDMPSGWIDPTAQIGEGTNVFSGAHVGAGAIVGTNCDLLPGVVVGDGVVIGDDCVLHPHVVLYPRIRLGNRVIIHAGAVIGADGFGYRFADGRFERLPHRGTVIIEDDVEIGACATIDRALIDATVIGTGTKIDNLVMIAHNCRIGKHNAFASQVGFAGSCTTGDYVRCGGQVGVADHIHIGAGASLGGKAGVMADLAAQGTYYGIPARPEKDALKQHLALMRVPEMREQLQRMQAEIDRLHGELDQLRQPAPEEVVALPRAA